MIFQGYSGAECRQGLDEKKDELEDLHMKLHCYPVCILSL